MPIFALQTLPHLRGKVQVYELFEDAKSSYNIFWNKHRSDSFTPMLLKLQTRLREAAHLKLLPKEKMRNITPDGEDVPEFEIKADDLRMYVIKNQEGFIIINVGLKGDQSKDIAKMRKVKARFLSGRRTIIPFQQ